MSRPRPVDVARCALGVVALARPDLILRVSQHEHGTAARRAVRVLGARYLVQSGGGMVLERTWIPTANALVDLVHAASMLAIAAISPAHQRLALLSAGAAVGFADVDLREKVR